MFGWLTAEYFREVGVGRAARCCCLPKEIPSFRS